MEDEMAEVKMEMRDESTDDDAVVVILPDSDNSDCDDIPDMSTELPVAQNAGPGELPAPRQQQDQPFKCSLCPQSFYLLHQLITHERQHMGLQKFVCVLCSKGFGSKQTLTTHMETHSPFKPYNCESCSKSFRQKGQLVAHQRVHSGERPFRCHLCPRAFRQLTALNNHLRTHTGDKPFVCLLCNERFTQKSNLMQHIAIHSAQSEESVSQELHQNGANAFQFPSNGIPMHPSSMSLQMSRDLLSTAVSNVTNKDANGHGSETFPNPVHGLSSGPYDCNVCGEHFSSQDYLDAHSEKHGNGYSCKLCWKQFKRKSQLMSHKCRFKEDDEFFDCESCDNTFGSQQKLDNHRHKVHSVWQDLFKCDLCEYTCSTKSEFSLHLRSHGSYPSHPSLLTDADGNLEHYEHKVIKKEPGSDNLEHLYDLQRYMQPNSAAHYGFVERAQNKSKVVRRSHFKQKFKCKLCNKEFNHKSTYKIHMATHTRVPNRYDSLPDGHFRCKLCNVKFESLAEITEHHTVKTGLNSSAPKCCICPKVFKNVVGFNVHAHFHIISTSNLKELKQENIIRTRRPKAPSKLFEALETGEFKCRQCECIFPTLDAIQAHTLRYKDGIKMFKCCTCQRRFKYGTWYAHIKRCYIGFEFKCPKCLDVLPSYAKLKKHSRECGKEVQPIGDSRKPRSLVKTEFTCELCDQSFMYRSVYTNHMEKHDRVPNMYSSLPDGHYRCKLCNVKFESTAEILEHNKSQPNSNLLKCCVCPKVLKNKTGFTGHARFHLASKAANAKLIAKNLEKKPKKVSKRYQQLESGEFKCRQCEKVFPSLSTIRSHTVTYRNAYKAFKCCTCFKVYDTAGSWFNHCSTCFLGREFKCSKCSEVFTSHVTLKQHRLECHRKPESHAKIPKRFTPLADGGYRCNLCASVFENLLKAKCHNIAIGASGKCFRCCQCTKLISNASAFYSHIRICTSNTVDKGRIMNRHISFSADQHLCVFCNTMFGSKALLRAHNTTFVNEKKFFRCCKCHVTYHARLSWVSHTRDSECAEMVKQQILMDDSIRDMIMNGPPMDMKVEHPNLEVNDPNLVANDSKMDIRINDPKIEVKTDHSLDASKVVAALFQSPVSKKPLFKTTITKVPLNKIDRQYECLACKETFCSLKDKKLHYGAENNRYTCCKCQKVLSQGGFHYHIQKCAGILPYPCPMCGKGFVSLAHRKIHMNTRKCCSLVIPKPTPMSDYIVPSLEPSSRASMLSEEAPVAPMMSEPSSPATIISESPQPGMISEPASPATIICESPSPAESLSEPPSPAKSLSENASPVAILPEVPQTAITLDELPQPAFIAEQPQSPATPELPTQTITIDSEPSSPAAIVSEPTSPATKLSEPQSPETMLSEQSQNAIEMSEQSQTEITSEPPSSAKKMSEPTQPTPVNSEPPLPAPKASSTEQVTSEESSSEIMDSAALRHPSIEMRSKYSIYQEDNTIVLSTHD